MPPEELTFRQSLDMRMQTFEHDMRNSNSRIEIAVEKGFDEVHRRQDITNGRVRFAEKMIWLAMGFCACVSVILIPLLIALVHDGKL